MPIFDNELIDNTSNRNYEQPKIDLRSIVLPEVDTNPNMGGFESYNQVPAKRGLTVDEISEMSRGVKSSTGWDSPIELVSKGELLSNKRYPMFQRDVDLENVYGLQQSWYNKLGRSLVKTGITAAGTFAQSLTDIPNTVSAIKSGNMSKLSGDPNGYEGGIDSWMKNMEDVIPNYMTREEKAHPYLAMIPFAPGSANFWGESVFKNLGFTAGAIAGAALQDVAVGAITGGIGEVPLVANQIGKAALWLNKLAGGTNKIDTVLDLAKGLGKTEQQLLKIEKLGNLAQSTKVLNGMRYGLITWGAAQTESGVESRDGYRHVKEELIKEYKIQNYNEEPTGDALAEIENYATNAMNTRFGINMALLTVSNAVQFGNLFKSFTTAQKGITGTLAKVGAAGKIGLKEGSIDVFEKKSATGLGSRIWDSVKPRLANVLAEGVYEEGGQFAAERGTYDYYTRKYKNLSNPNNKKNWDDLTEITSSTTYGLSEQFNTTEGINNMIVGGITAMLTGSAQQFYDYKKGNGADKRLDSSINALNRYGLTGILSDKYDNTLSSMAIAKEMQAAADSGNVFKYKNLKHDMFFNYVQSRIPSGMHDVTIEQLNMLKDLSKEDFEKSFGMDFNASNQNTVAGYVDSLIKKANDIKSTTEAIDGTFKNPFAYNIDPKNEEEATEAFNYATFENWKKDLTYYGTVKDDVNDRLESIEEKVISSNPLINNDILSKVTDKDSLTELSRSYEEQANRLNGTINESTTTADKKAIREQVKALRTASEKINLALNNGNLDLKTFHSILNFELNNQDSKKDDVVGFENATELFNYGADINRLTNLKKNSSEIFDKLASEEGFDKYFKQAEDIAKEEVPLEDLEKAETSFTFVNKERVKEPLQVDREYEIKATKKASIKKLADDRYEVTSPDGTVSFHKTKEEAAEEAKDLTDESTNLSKVKVIALNEDGTVKVEDVNGDILNIDPTRLSGYKKLETDQEKLLKNKEQLTKEQADIENNSGTVAISTDTSFTPKDEAGAIVNANIFFQSGTTESEDYNDPTLSAQHIKNSREFLNNIDSLPNKGNMRAILVTPGQEKLVGLEGLAKLSYGSYDMSNILDVENGFIGQVFIVQEGGKSYFIDKTGTQLGEVGKQLSEEDMKKVIFQTMRTTKTTDSKNNPRFRGKQQELFEAYKKEYIKFREDLIANQDQMPAPFEFTVSRGIPIENIDANGIKERNHVGGILIDKDKIGSQENLIVIPTTGSIFHNGQSIKFPDGTPVLQYGSTLQFLNNKKFNTKEASTIFQVVKAFAADTLAQSESGAPIRLNRDYSDYLQNVLYWRVGQTKTNNQININTSAMTIQIGGKEYSMSEIANNEKEIVDNLKEAFNAINNTTLTKKFDDEFLEYTLDKNGELNKEPIEWKNYQTYLLSDKNPDGSARAVDSTPLTTSVAAPTAELPYSFKQKYATVEGMGLSIPTPTVEDQVAEPSAPGVEKIGEYTIGNDIPNTYTLSGDRPVIFTAEIDENGKVAVQIESNETTKTLATDKLPDGRLKVDAIIVPELKKIALEKEQEFDLTKTNNEEYVFDYLANIIASDLQNKKDTAVAPEEAPVVEETVVEETPVVEEEKKEIPTGADRFSGGPANLPGYRAVGADGNERMTDAEIQLFKTWHADNVPNIPFQILENIIERGDIKAWGVFENGVAKFVRGGLRGTEYHEIFEGIYKGMLSPEEQQALLDEFKAKPGVFTDRQSGKKINYADATDLQAKERIADDFSDFRKGKLPARSLGEAIRNFFAKILNFFKSFVTNPSLKEELFKAIDTGKFKERTLSPTVINDAAEYRAVEGLTEQQTREFVQDMTARAAGILYSEGEKGLLFSPDGTTSDSMYSKIKAQYSNEYYANGFSKIELLGDVAWDQLKEKTTLSLRTLGISFNEEDRVSINDEEANKNDYAPEPFSTDWKKNSTGAIKFSLATLLEVQATNQEASLSFKLPAPKVSSIVGFKLLNFTRAFATVLDKLSNTTSVTKMVDKLSDLAKDDPNYVRLFQRVGGKLSNRSVPFSDFDATDWRYFIQFTQTFTKQKPDALIQYKEGGETYVAPANLYTAIKQTQKGWMENIKMLASSDASLISYDKPSRNYQVDTVRIQDLPTNFPQDRVKFLEEIGIDFPLEVYNKLKDLEQVSFERAVSAIKKYLGAEKDIMTLSGKTLGNIGGQLSKLAELYNKVTNPSQESTYTGVEGQKMGAFAENNAPSLFENEFNEANTLDELLEKRPELRDVYSKGSQVLKKGGLFFDVEGKRIKEMKVSYIQGTKLIDQNKGITTSKLSLGERFTQEINQNLDGNYYVLIPADGSTEWMMNLGNTIKLKEIEGGRAWSKINKIFQGYLMDDINLALDADNRKQLRNVTDKAKELRFFKDILSEKALADINELIEDNATMESFETYISENAEDINASIKEYIDSTVAETRAVLTENKQIISLKPNEFSYSGLIDTFAKDEAFDKFALSDQTVNDILTFANVNYIINNIEYHKVLFGDPYQFAIKKDGSLDETKRIKSFLSPRRTTFDTPEFNTFLNQNLNKIGEINLKPGDPGYQQFKAYTNTVTFKDVTIAGSLSNVNKAFSKTNEADAMSWLMDGTYREIKLKNGQWSEQAEAWHQWQMAYTRQNYPGYTYTSDNLQRHDVALMKTKEPKHILEVLKPIVSGNKYGKNNLDLVLDKFSQMPVYYSMVKGTTMEKLYTKMFEAGIGYAIVESGRKVGAEELHSLYNQDGSFNDDAFNNNIQVPWKSYGIQVETATEGAKEQTRGSQLTKLSSMDLFDNGQTIGATPERQEAIRNEYNRNVRILNDLHQHGYNTLLTRLGVVDTGNGFTLKDGKAVSETLMRELLRREASDNTIDTLQLDKDTNQFLMPFEASPSYIEIRNVLYSLIDKSIISPKMNGGAHVQVPATMFEQATKGRSLTMKNKEGVWEKITKEKYKTLSDEEKAGVMLTDDTLKFYVNKEGERYCEVLIPHWFKGKLGQHANKTDEELIEYLNNTPDGKALLQGIGFRIPTQALSSVEAIRVKGFLPQYMGSTVVVPSEITTKAGSDFDIDKLNMYLKSTYLDKNGDVRLIKYMGSEEATKEFYGELFDKGLLLTKEQTKQLEQELALGKDAEYEDRLVKSMFGDLGVFSDEDIIDDFTKSLTEQGVKETVVNEMYKKSLENEYYDSLEKLITLPENFNRLVNPINDAGLKALSIELDKLRGYDETTIKNRMLDRNYLTTLRNSFVTAKRWIGVAAVNITNLSLKQKSEVYIDPSKFSGLSERDERFLGDGEIALKHNTVMIDGKERVSLSGTTVKDSTELISDRLSGYATSFVDVAKDDYITKIVQSDLAIGTFMFLENIGAGEQTAMFLNQPIISEYLKYLNSVSAKGLFTGKNISVIKNRFITTKDNLMSTELNVTNLDGNIRDYYAGTTFNATRNAEQHKILDEFLKYAKMAEFNFKFTQATNYDTTKLRSAETLSKKQWRTQTALDTNIISSVDNILNSTFIGPQSKFLDKSTEAMGAVLKLDELKFKEITNTVLKSFGDNEYLANDKFEKIAVEIKAAFIDYVVQNDTKYSDKIKELLIDDNTSVAVRMEIAKRDNPDMQILKELQAETGERSDGVKTIRLKVRPDNANDKNMYTGMMRELRDNPATNQLYKDIVKLSILQGTYSSPLSIREIIPIEDYSAIVEPIISGLTVNKTLDDFTKGWYQRNNFMNSDVFPIVENIKFFIDYNEKVINTPEGPIYKYFSYSFPGIEGLGIKGDDRKILLLSEKYNFMDLKHDYVRIPRVVGGVDMVNGKEVNSADYARRRAKGDFSLKDYFGYEKVKDKFGQPVIHYITVKDEVIGHHIYKLINLYGDGNRATENYEYFKPSVIDNGSMKIDTEIPNDDIINYYGASLEKEDLFPPTSEYTDEDIERLMNPPEEEYFTEEEMENYGKEVKPTVEKPKQRELFTIEKGIAQKSFRGKTLNFVDNIATTKETVVAMSNSKKTGVISIDQKAMAQKFEDKAWTKPAKQSDGSFATPLAENQFSTMDEWFTFALIHELKHDTILKQEGETTGQYEDRINQAAIADLNKNYNVPVKVDAAELSNEYKAIDKQNVRDQLINQEYYISTGEGTNEKNIKVDENNVEDALNLKGDAELVTKGFGDKFFIAGVPNAVYNIPSGSGSIEYESIEDILSDVADESNRYLSAEEKLSAIEYLKQYGIDLSEKEFIDPNQLSLFNDEAWEQEENNDTCEPF